MVKEIIKYPQTPSTQFNAPVRAFDDNLRQLLEDLKDTIEANNLEGLSAYQIGNPFNVMVIKKDGQFLEMINARILQKKGKITTDETTTYFPNLSASVTRDKEIKVMYETRDGEQKYLDAVDNFAILLQRKIDYNFGSNFRFRLDDKEKEKLDMRLTYGKDVLLNDTCPQTFQRDKILKVINILLLAIVVGIGAKFFISDDLIPTITTYLNYTFIADFVLLIIYFFYAQYEGAKYTSCTSCQIGNIIGVTIIHLTKLAILFGVFAYLF